MTSTLAVIVTFNPKIYELRDLLDWAKDEPINLIIIDNASDNAGDILKITLAYSNIIFQQLSGNFGLALAQNIGIEHAIKLGFHFVLLLDQDSLPEAGFVRRAIAAFDECDLHAKNVAGVAPRFFDSRTGYSYPFVRFDRLFVKVFQPKRNLEDVSLIISSGAMLRVSALQVIGLMSERFFIDHIDTDWCLRAISMGYRFIGVSSNTMRHSVGDATVRFAGRNLPVHKPSRRYLCTRNLFYLISHSKAPMHWKIKEFFSSFIKLVVVVAKQSDRRAHLRAFFAGLLDGLRSDFSREYR
jgi:rhamnosyltransferase